jgi:GNAT superfamily N-acetyltransferase
VIPHVSRRATPDDAAAIAAVNVASWRTAYRGLMPDAYLDALDAAESAVQWAASLRREPSKGKRTIVAERDGTVVGYATVGPDADSGAGMLLLMYLAPEVWGRGLGRELMQGARETLLELGYQAAALWVLEQNERARRFYEADGWRADGAIRDDDYGGVRLRAIRMICRTNN